MWRRDGGKLVWMLLHIWQGLACSWLSGGRVAVGSGVIVSDRPLIWRCWLLMALSMALRFAVLSESELRKCVRILRDRTCRRCQGGFDACPMTLPKLEAPKTGRGFEVLETPVGFPEILKCYIIKAPLLVHRVLSGCFFWTKGQR